MKIEFFAKTNNVGSRCSDVIDIDDDDLRDIETEDELANMLSEYLRDCQSNFVDLGWCFPNDAGAGVTLEAVQARLATQKESE